VGAPSKTTGTPPTTTTSTVAVTTTTIEATTTTFDPDDLDNWPERVVQFIIEMDYLEHEFETEYLVALGWEMCKWVDYTHGIDLVISAYGEHDGTLLMKSAERWLCDG
jgi:hypothetical protein